MLVSILDNGFNIIITLDIINAMRYYLNRLIYD